MEDSRRSSQASLKVQFADDVEISDHNSEIHVQVQNQIVVKVQLGFLQIDHKYEITFSFESPEPLENVFTLEDHSTCNVDIVELKLHENNDPNNQKSFTHEVKVHLLAKTEKYLTETISLQTDESKVLTFKFNAMVLGKDKGTPFLKNGIKCIGFVMDDVNAVDEDQ